MSDAGKGFSAAKAGKIERRVKPEKIEATEYTVYDENSRITGRFAKIAALCKGVKATTLKRRLARGVRELTKLRAEPTKPGRRMK